MRRVDFHPQAEAELLAAARFYEEHAENLGFDFLAAVQGAYERLAEFPESGHSFGRRLRRVLVPGFPYALLYSVHQEQILIVAVAHVHRSPGYWRSRR